MRKLLLGLGAAFLMVSIGVGAAEPQAAVMWDPPQDQAHPANAIPFALTTHGVRMGHNMGGSVAGWLAGHDDHLACAILISPGKSFGNLPGGSPLRGHPMYGGQPAE